MEDKIKGIENIIKRIEAEYQQNQGLILSEDDLKCLAYKYLFELYSAPMETMDPEVKAIQLHTEIPWYDNNGHLSIYPDITIILNPKQISIKHGSFFKVKDGVVYYGKLPRKQFRFSGDAILIEFKFIKRKSGAKQTDSTQIERDIRKMLGLIEKHNNVEKITGVMIIFNKTDKGKALMEELVSKYRDIENLKMMYCSGKVSFEAPNQW